jgi:MYXO-CTERM domain-containing protein
MVALGFDGALDYGPIMPKQTNRRARGALALVALMTLAPSDVAAHFVLEEPAASRTQDALGNPQKLGPCGGEGGADTGEITAVQTGSTITITIDETIFHPGHYRVSLAMNDPSELPPEPPVTAGSSPCGSTTIMDPPVFPVLADGVLEHTMAFSGPQSFQVQLPPGVTCDHCTLQILEFMSHHMLNDPGGCFYHHCATLSIHDVVVEDAGMSTMEDTGPSTSVDSGNGTTDAGSRDAGASTPPPQACACSAPGRSDRSGLPVLAMLGLAALVSRRRR